MKGRILDIKDYGLYDDHRILLVKLLSTQCLSLHKLENLYKNHPKTSRIAFKDILALLHKLDLIEIEDECVKLSHLGERYKAISEYHMKKNLVIALIKKICEEDELFIKYLGLTYDPYINSYVLKHKLPLKYSALRNMLIQYSVCLYSENDEDTLVIDDKYIEAFNKFTRNIISQTELDSILENKKEAGNVGEEFVLKYEIRRLNSQNLKEKISRISLYDVSAGFDILSYSSDNSIVYDRFIEVKTHNGSGVFYWSKNEIEVSKRLSNEYYLYLVDLKRINEIEYEPDIIINPYKNVFVNTGWEKTTELISVRNTEKYNIKNY